MSAMTIPLPTLLLGLLGLGFLIRRLITAVRAASSPMKEWLLLLNVLVPPAVIALPTVPIFGGTKHWMTMMPFFCLPAADALWRAALEVKERRGAVAAAVLVGGVLLIPIAETARTHPLGHTYFNEITGGQQGGAALGMPRTFWGGDGRELLEALNREARAGATVFTDRMNQDDFMAYQRDGLLRGDLRQVFDVRRAQWALINHQREYRHLEYAIWNLRGDRRAHSSKAFDGVPIVSLYRLDAGATAR